MFTLILPLLLSSPARAGDLYLVRQEDGSMLLTDSPRSSAPGEFNAVLWWDDDRAGANWVARVPDLDKIAGIDAYDADFLAAATDQGLPAELLKALCITESRMNPAAVSRRGARGLMQLMPATAKGLGVTDAHDPTQAIRGGARYLADQLATFGEYKLALAAYNAGPGNVRKYGGIPPFPETERYVAQVMRIYDHLRASRPVVSPRPGSP